jgi:hypothetical protein
VKRAHLLAPAGWVAIAAVWWIVARLALADGLQSADVRAIESASAMLHDRMALLSRTVERECALLADDPRIRVALATPGIDEATFADLLGDFRNAIGSDIIVLVSADGRILATAKDKHIAGGDLSPAAVIQGALKAESAVSDVWGYGDRFIVAGASAIRIDGNVAAAIVVGASIGQDSLTAVGNLTHVAWALLVHGQVVALWPEALRTALSEAGKSAPGPDATIDVNGSRYRMRVEALGDRALPASAVWLRESEASKPDFLALSWLLWAPFAVGAVGGALMYARSSRNARNA